MMLIPVLLFIAIIATATTMIRRSHKYRFPKVNDFIMVKITEKDYREGIVTSIEDKKISALHPSGSFEFNWDNDFIENKSFRRIERSSIKFFQKQEEYRAHRLAEYNKKQDIKPKTKPATKSKTK